VASQHAFLRYWRSGVRMSSAGTDLEALKAEPELAIPGLS
jgi:hypothetical protein